MNATRAELAVVMPVYNEEANIAAVVGEWIAELQRLGISFVMLPVNDGSRDGTGPALEKLAAQFPGVLAPIGKANAGHGRACRTGYDAAVQSGVAWTLQIDSDGQCDPGFFAGFWSAREQADAVFGVRATRDDGFSRVLISATCRAAASLLTGIDLRDANVPYRLVRTAKLQAALARIPTDFDMQNVALTVALKRDKSVRWAYAPIHFRNRQGGTNSINLKSISRMGWRMLRDMRRVK